MRTALICPNCGTKKVVDLKVWLAILLAFTLIGVLIYLLVFVFKYCKCPKCKTMMQNAIVIQKQNFGNAEVVDIEDDKVNDKKGTKKE